jgi:hypothetical protein
MRPFGLFQKRIEYFDHLRPGEKFGKIQDGECEDRQCPCGLYGTRIPRGGGYLIITDEVVEFRTKARSLETAEKQLAAIRDPTLKARMKPLLVCERSRLLKVLDQDVAAHDARYWWETHLVPLRPTPGAGLAAGVYKVNKGSLSKQNGALKDRFWEQRVFEFAKKKHADQVDEEGRPIFDTHILQVVKMVKMVTFDRDTISAAYLHDTIEKTQTSQAELEKRFGPRVTQLVMELTRENNEEGAAYFPRLHSREAILVKFADRLSNLSRIESWDEAQQLRYLEESKFWSSRSDDKNRKMPSAS